jgi:hypothetical protein
MVISLSLQNLLFVVIDKPVVQDYGSNNSNKSAKQTETMTIVEMQPSIVFPLKRMCVLDAASN